MIFTETIFLSFLFLPKKEKIAQTEKQNELFSFSTAAIAIDDKITKKTKQNKSTLFDRYLRKKTKEFN